MPKVVFTANIQRLVACPDMEAAGRDVRGVLDDVFRHNPQARGYILDDQAALRMPVGGKLAVTRTRDGGKTFETLTKGLPQQHAYDVVYRHALDIDETGNRLVMGSTTGGLWISENQGDGWSEITHTLPPVYAARFV